VARSKNARIIWARDDILKAEIHSHHACRLPRHYRPNTALFGHHSAATDLATPAMNRPGGPRIERGPSATATVELPGALSSRSLLILFILSLALAIFKWCTLLTVMDMDPSFWIKEFFRYATGEVPYRDFYWPYGPLPAMLFAYSLRLFGMRIEVLQVVIDLLSLINVFAFYRLAVRLLPETLAFWASVTFIAIGATVTTYFSLFGLVAYTPAIHVAAIGLMLLLTEVVIYLDTGSCRLWLSALSSFLACAAKQETLAASVIVVGSLCLFDRWLWFQGKTISAWLTHYVKLGLACFVPAALLYIQWGQIAGWTKFLACLSGFGLAKTACPWWPTGFGLLGAASSLAKAAFILLIGALFCYRKNWPSRLPRRSMVVLLAAISMAVFLYAEWGLFADLIAGSGSMGKRIARFGQELLSTRSVLRPVLWAGMALSVVLAWKTLKLLRTSRKTPLDPEIIKWLLLLTCAAFLCLRSLFGTILVSTALEVPAIAYPFLILLGPWLWYNGLRWCQPEASAFELRRMRTLVIAALVCYSMVRLAGGYPALLDPKLYRSIETRAGTVRLAEAVTEKPLIEYVLAHTEPGEYLLSMPFAGAMNFFTDTREPTYSSLFFQLRPSQLIQQEDLTRIQQHPPRLVLAREGPHFSTLYGIAGDVGCVAPNLVWLPKKPSSDPDYVFPFVDYLTRNYHASRQFGPWIIYERSEVLAP
jgi:hypothetical protein